MNNNNKIINEKRIVFDVVEYIIIKTPELTDTIITNTKLNKLLYYAQGLYLSYSHNFLFDAEIQAWKYGPIIPKIYFKYMDCLDKEIISKKKITTIPFNKKITIFLDFLIKNLGKLDAYTLMQRTHKELPWLESNK
ncbi:MAG: DUF4065 domain-containing protein [Candidatus Phytoplasma stylosanthis]|nr:DUF4065 domain-containing protein [Candidatus Phytoplasma stylosanthis]